MNTPKLELLWHVLDIPERIAIVIETLRICDSGLDDGKFRKRMNEVVYAAKNDIDGDYTTLPKSYQNFLEGTIIDSGSQINTFRKLFGKLTSMPDRD
ncbi:hypothetical protein H7X65_02285 [Candidatus Parcubacteria bacterium]|nr:hypothetical protein [Candidatus Parcubacteria bacterium]